MADLEKLIELQEISSKENAELKQQMAAQTELITRLLGSVNVGGQNLNIQPAAPSAADIRKSEISKLYINLKKSQKVKDYKEASSENICEWIAKYDLEVANIAKMTCNLDLSNKPLTRQEYIDCIK